MRKNNTGSSDDEHPNDESLMLYFRNAITSTDRHNLSYNIEAALLQNLSDLS